MARHTGQEIRRAHYETRTELVCPWCDQFETHYGIVNYDHAEDEEAVYECRFCFRFFTLPKD